MPIPVTSIAAIVSVPVPMIPAVITPVASLVVVARRRSTPMGWRVAQEIDRLATGVVAAAVAAPVARMAGRHPHINGLHLRHYRATPHRLRIQQLRRCITDVDLTVNPGRQLPGNGATDIGLGLGGTRCANQRQSRQAASE
jgi:hypothetical protein